MMLYRKLARLFCVLGFLGVSIPALAMLEEDEGRSEWRLYASSVPAPSTVDFHNVFRSTEARPPIMPILEAGMLAEDRDRLASAMVPEGMLEEDASNPAIKRALRILEAPHGQGVSKVIIGVRERDDLYPHYQEANGKTGYFVGKITSWSSTRRLVETGTALIHEATMVNGDLVVAGLTALHTVIDRPHTMVLKNCEITLADPYISPTSEMASSIWKDNSVVITEILVDPTLAILPDICVFKGVVRFPPTLTGEDLAAIKGHLVRLIQRNRSRLPPAPLTGQMVGCIYHHPLSTPDLRFNAGRVIDFDTETHRLSAEAGSSGAPLFQSAPGAPSPSDKPPLLVGIHTGCLRAEPSQVKEIYEYQSDGTRTVLTNARAQTFQPVTEPLYNALAAGTNILQSLPLDLQKKIRKSLPPIVQ